MISGKINILSALSAVVLTSSIVFALPDASTVTDIRYTVHNLSNNTLIANGLAGEGRNYAATSTGQADQVCVFCHTPHNASPAVPLWNKVYTPGVENSYRLYTSSATLTATAKGAKITADSESMLCLSCHDGKTAINVLHNSSYRDSSNGTDAVIDIDGTLTGSGPFALGQQWFGGLGSFNYPNLGAIRSADGSIPSSAASLNGTNFTDDHPIGFSYTAAQAQNTAGLKVTPDAGIRLFGPTKRIECSSCHNPHIYYGSGLAGGTRIYFNAAVGSPAITDTLVVTATQKAKTPFLNISNTGSNLCKGCHIK
jgi:hypothetical protein